MIAIHNRKRLERIFDQTAYDLMKLRGKKLVERIRTTRYYRIKSVGLVA